MIMKYIKLFFKNKSGAYNPACAQFIICVLAVLASLFFFEKNINTVFAQIFWGAVFVVAVCAYVSHLQKEN